MIRFAFFFCWLLLKDKNKSAKTKTPPPKIEYEIIRCCFNRDNKKGEDFHFAFLLRKIWLCFYTRTDDIQSSSGFEPFDLLSIVTMIGFYFIFAAILMI